MTGRQLSEDDIDVKLVRKFLEDVGSNHRDQNHDNLSLLYQSLKLVRSIGDKKVGERLLPILVPRNVALLFFSPEPEKYLRGAQSEIATYNHDNDPVDDNPVRGPIDQQIEAILSYISDEKKEEVPYTFVPYPMRALREAVVNAFYHRGYEPDQCEPVKIHIYPNYIDIISYPGPHPSLKLEYFKEGQEIPPVQARNRRIGELLKERKLAEARGSGVRTIFRTMKQNKSPTPSFMFDSTYFRVRLPGHPKHVAHAVNNKVDNLCAKGEKESAVELLTTFLKENPNMISEFLLGKLLELHDNNKRHPNVQPYEQYISERLERRRPLITELCKWSVSDGTVDITAGVKIVKKLVDEGATCDDLQSATKKAVDFLNERSDDGKQVLEKVQNAHKLFEAMGEVNQTDPYVAYQFACCKFNLYLLNTKGLPDRKKKEFVCLLKDAEDFIQKASQLTSKEHKNHLASQNRQRGYIHFLLLLVKKSTVKEVVDCYDKAKECNPGIRINQFYIPLEYRTRFMESQWEQQKTLTLAFSEEMRCQFLIRSSLDTRFQWISGKRQMLDEQPDKMLEVKCNGLVSHLREVEIILVARRYRSWR